MDRNQRFLFSSLSAWLIGDFCGNRNCSPVFCSDEFLAALLVLGKTVKGAANWFDLGFSPWSRLTAQDSRHPYFSGNKYFPEGI